MVNAVGSAKTPVKALFIVSTIWVASDVAALLTVGAAAAGVVAEAGSVYCPSLTPNNGVTRK